MAWWARALSGALSLLKIELGLDMKYDLEAKAKEIDRVIHKIGVQRVEGGLSEAEADRRIQYQIEKKRALLEEARKKLQ